MKTLFISIFFILLPLPSYAEIFHLPSCGSSGYPADSLPDVSDMRRVGIKTNGVLWGATVMNAEGELFFHPHVSCSLGLAWCPWFLSDKFSLRNLSILPEARWWLNKNMSGHFFGIHISVSWYNVKYEDYRYQDTGRPLLGAGITYGYYFPLTKHWGIELSVGAGYVNMRYDRFLNVSNGPKLDTRQTSWFGIDRAAVSLSYRLPL